MNIQIQSITHRSSRADIHAQVMYDAVLSRIDAAICASQAGIMMGCITQTCGH